MTAPDLRETHPLPAVSLDEATARQFRLLECVADHFDGWQLFSPDVGVTPRWGRPDATRRAEAALADFFGAPAAALVQGAGSGAIRAMLTAALAPGRTLIVHSAPAYATTATAFRAMGLELIETDFHSSPAEAAASHVYVQHSRQLPGDSYDPAEVIAQYAELGVRALVDDNYAAFRTPRTGVEMGAEASALSMFKLLGPEGVGLVVGSDELVDRVHADNYSGGGQVQGPQALDALRALTHVPVLWAVQSAAVTEVAERLAAGEVPGVAQVRIANAQDRCVLVRLDAPCARRVIEAAARYGAAPYPVGANSRYEITPLFYRLSETFLAGNPELADWTIRINPMRSGPDLVIKILNSALGEVRCS
ncbi:aminotransferase class I/II-fold pyridoxal phosphate-dependent enzyme [Actinomadura spongiicola]|uniref:Aminotransferase class I/II-fold pyridoxal phosphate-dependent enzyme n=1 Tax=Actinomadura spongiicola TaxID=2303421 RepID=A0A372GGZ4_9ACTN|nr:aminotransferase class I/II-fold pyridoxal phosphate-dependent enzyme [Actinomadura spongiicola]RFS84630.1 aminotransferase class I/II-fold pyridoxal phosphate-dependent enzyme [Actinomadura spongiicola]